MKGLETYEKITDLFHRTIYGMCVDAIGGNGRGGKRKKSPL